MFVPVMAVAKASFTLLTTAIKAKVTQFAMEKAIEVAEAALKVAAKKGGRTAEEAVTRLEDLARRSEELAAVEPNRPKARKASAIALAAKAAAAAFRQLSTVLNQKADDGTMEAAVAKAAEKLRELIKLNRKPPMAEIDEPTR